VLQIICSIIVGISAPVLQILCSIISNIGPSVTDSM
jgi:hypothetical protein